MRSIVGINVPRPQSAVRPSSAVKQPFFRKRRSPMRALLRHLMVFPEGLAYGFPYAFLQHLIRSPRPLDPDWLWRLLQREAPKGPLFNFLRFHYPPAFARPALLFAKLRQDHL